MQCSHFRTLAERRVGVTRPPRGHHTAGDVSHAVHWLKLQSKLAAIKKKKSAELFNKEPLFVRMKEAAHKDTKV